MVVGSGGSGCGGSGLWWQQVVVSGSNVHVVLKEEVLVNLQMKKNEKKKYLLGACSGYVFIVVVCGYVFIVVVCGSVVIASGGR